MRLALAQLVLLVAGEVALVGLAQRPSARRRRRGAGRRRPARPSPSASARWLSTTTRSPRARLEPAAVVVVDVAGRLELHADHVRSGLDASVVRCDVGPSCHSRRISIWIRVRLRLAF